MSGRSKKAVKQHYNKILADPEQRKKHFGAGGALGSEAEGRDIVSREMVREHNQRVQLINDFHQRDDVDEKIDELRKGKRISLMR